MGKILKSITLSVLLFIFLVPLSAQARKVVVHSSSGDNVNCGVYLSAYREFFKLKLYQYAYDHWWNAFNNCPDSSEKLYVDGVTMYRSFLDSIPDGPEREGKIDTLMLIYDQRMVHFGGEGNVLGRKGRDLFAYRKGDLDEVQKAYDMLQRSVTLEGTKSKESVLVSLISAGATLKMEERLDDVQLMGDYVMVAEILDQLTARSSRWERTRASVDEIMLREELFSCETLNRFYEPLFEQKKNDKAFLEGVISICKVTSCDRTDIYTTVSETLYQIEPGPESAHNLAILFINRSEFEKAATYLKEALAGEAMDKETRSQWYYELAVVSSAIGEQCEAIEYAREAIKLNSSFGKAYLLLGDTFIASRENLGNDFEQRTAFWAAADMYRKASLTDDSISAEAKQKLRDYAAQYPDSEEVFFHDIKDGDPYRVGGCINESTTVRSRK